ncbi:hypothetical protein [Desulforhopalus sp. IMCC35007]|uniref:hypothetical protein n=1 Tax=Desulforhopalus sp. IMCC35007 TaxID=2569543 RepID=UPI0010AED2C9|nr:hypothetical protein [Desulforhopalus sp. IMCC35007]TKB05959.1 hypothetical protein FCL48_22865 [Desulforhopalus sp. IMCC35007]
MSKSAPMFDQDHAVSTLRTLSSATSVNASLLSDHGAQPPFAQGQVLHGLLPLAGLEAFFLDYLEKFALAQNKVLLLGMVFAQQLHGQVSLLHTRSSQPGDETMITVSADFVQ